MATKQEMVLVIGACGQLGSELTLELRYLYGGANVVAADITAPQQADLRESGPFEQADVLDTKALRRLTSKYTFSHIYHLAAILSAAGEKNPAFTWRLNMDGLLHVLDLAREQNIARVFWPSSIAVFGPHTPRHHTPQYTPMDPNTVYGISKQAGELWCAYYFEKYGLDVRSLRYPGLISYKAPPGGGTTDYAVDIYHKALTTGKFECYLREDTYLPMLYMPDAIIAALDLVQAPASQVTVRSAYNLGGLSLAPKDIAAAIREHIPAFEISYKSDYRQQIADSWPQSIDDSCARHDWGWKPAYDLPAMTADMLQNLKSNLSANPPLPL